jgi:hypothetical protein
MLQNEPGKINSQIKGKVKGGDKLKASLKAGNIVFE